MKWTEDDLIADVGAAPPGPSTGAFFDFDGTVIDGYSLGSFVRHHLRSLEVTPVDLAQLMLSGLRGVSTEEDFERFTAIGLRAWAGRSEDELAELGERLFTQAIAGSLFPEAWRLVTAHLNAGHTVVLASSATRFQVEPAARALGVEHILVSPVEIVDGVCTGRPGGPLLWRSGKAAAVKDFAAAHGIDLKQSFAYSNGHEDVPFLRTAGRARALNPTPGLAAAAAHFSWPVARFRSRGRTGPADVLRTAAGYGGMFGGFWTGLTLGALSGSRREAVDLGITLAGELASALGGVRVDVEGAEHLATRPAVVLFNHQSQLDVIILAKVLRGGFTAVAKKELANSPAFGALFRLADVAFIDRSSTEKARQQLEPAVRRLRDGISIVIAPEGTRTATPTLAPFKKGAFHLALQAGVPIVPVVIRNSGELMWRGASAIHAGTVQVRVLPPVPTDDWTVDDLDQHVEEVRDQYVRALGDWTGHGGRPVSVGNTGGSAGSQPPPDLPLEWGAAPAMNALETVVWRAEAHDPRLRATMTLLEILDPAPDWDRLWNSHEWASRMVPRMRQRVVDPILGVGAPQWVTVADFDLSRHLQRIELGGAGSMRELLDVAGGFAAEPLDRAQPLWAVRLVEGLSDGRAGLLIKTHHSVTDGLGALQLMGRLHNRSPEHDPARPEPPVPQPAEVSPRRLFTAQVSRTVQSLPLRLLRRGLETADLATRPWDAADRVLGTARFAARSLASPAGGSAVLRGRGGAWHVDVLDVPLDALRAGARAAGGSANDGYLAAVLGGFRRYHQRMGAGTGTLTLGLPLSLRAQDDPHGGNRFTGARWSTTLDDAGPAERIARVREFVISARATVASEVLDEFVLPVLGWLPAPLIGPVSGTLTSANDVQASNLPGSADPLYVAGSRITAMYPFGPLPGCAAMITLVAHEGQCCIGINVDTIAVTDPEGLTKDLRAGFDEVLALA